MKKFSIILFILLLLVGCSNSSNEQIQEETKTDDNVLLEFYDEEYLCEVITIEDDDRVLFRKYDNEGNIITGVYPFIYTDINKGKLILIRDYRIENETYLYILNDNVLNKKIIIDNKDLPIGFFAYQDEAKSYTLNENNNEIEIHSDYAYGTLTINIDKGIQSYKTTLTINDIPEFISLNGKDVISNEGNHLVAGSGDGGGDGWIHDIYYLSNDGTKVNYLYSGGNYHANGDFGFFKNGDAYIYDLYHFNVYKDGEYFYGLQDHFNLGKLDDGSTNVLFAVRRIDDSNYIFLYGNDNGEYVDGESFDQKLVNTYHIVFFENNKNDKEVDTKINISYSPFGYDSVNMETRENRYLDFETTSKLRTLKFTYDMENNELIFE